MGRRSTAAALVAGSVLNAAASYLNTAFLQGEPTAARVELHCSEARLCVTVTDNGRWVPPSSARAGMGLESMRQRAQELGGHTSTTATEGSGTRVRAWLPLAALPRAAETAGEGL